MFAASSSKARRAVAAAWRICTPPFWIERLPYVGPWSGVSAVSPSMMLTEGNGTSSVFGDDLTQRGSYACSKVNLTGFHVTTPRGSMARKASTSVGATVFTSVAV